MGEGGGERLLFFGQNSMLYASKLNALPPTTHSVPKNNSYPVQLTTGSNREKQKNSTSETKKVHPPDYRAQAGASPLKLKSKMPMIVERSEYV
jgi:hypothetical protein